MPGTATLRAQPTFIEPPTDGPQAQPLPVTCQCKLGRALAMPRRKKLREPGNTQVRNAWNQKKTRKHTIAVTLDEEEEKRSKKTAAKKTTAKKTTKANAQKTPAKKPRKASKATSKSMAKRSSRSARRAQECARRNPPAELRPRSCAYRAIH